MGGENTRHTSSTVGRSLATDDSAIPVSVDGEGMDDFIIKMGTLI